MSKPPLYIRGMHGIGDNLHQRAVMRVLKRHCNVTLESSWYSLYHDLIDENFRVVGRSVNLHTQLKNAAREQHLFAPAPPHHHVTRSTRLSYTTSTINQTASKTITEALFKVAGVGHLFPEADFRLPMTDEWLDKAEDIMRSWPTNGRPIMIYRPLCIRPEWLGSAVRNANTADYRTITDHLRRKFFTVSVASLAAGKEWIAEPVQPTDMAYHDGEFDIEILAAIMHRADLVITSGGMAAMLGPAVETPTISILGGYEPATWCADSGKFSPFLAIDPIRPCQCGSSGCQQRCLKKIDIPSALRRIDDFTSMMVSTDAEMEKCHAA